MLKDNGINRVKLFDSDAQTVDSLAGSGIEVMLGAPNNQLSILAGSLDDAKEWVKENVTKHLYNGGVDIKLVHNFFSSMQSFHAFYSFFFFLFCIILFSRIH